MSVVPSAEKLNVVGNDHGPTQMCDSSVLARKYRFWAHLVQSIKIFTRKLVPRHNSNMQSSMVKFNFSVFVQKYPFWKNLIQKTKIPSLSWNLVPSLIRIWSIQWWCSFFLIFHRRYFFCVGNLFQRNLILPD